MSELRVQSIKNTSLVDEFSFSEGGALGVGGNNFGTSGQVLTSQGSGSAPTWNSPTISVLSVQVFTSSGTYTPTSGKTTFLVYCIGGGGGGSASRSNQPSWGGGSGGCAWRIYDSTEMGSGASVTIGGGGAGGAANLFSGPVGAVGGDSIFNPAGSGAGAVTLTGGGGGGGVYADSGQLGYVSSFASYGYGGSSTNGHQNWKGLPGENPYGGAPGSGGNTVFFGVGQGGAGIKANATNSRGGPAYTTGNTGSSGAVIIFEY